MNNNGFENNENINPHNAESFDTKDTFEENEKASAVSASFEEAQQDSLLEHTSKEHMTQDYNTDEQASETASQATPQPIYGYTPKATAHTEPQTFSDGVRYTSVENHGVGYEWNGQNTQKTQKKKSSGTGLKVFTTALLAVFVVSFAALTVMVGGYIFDNHKYGNAPKVTSYVHTATTNPSSFAAITAPNADGKALTIPQIAAKCSPSAVGIMVEVESTANYSFGFGFSFPQSSIGTAIGSGFILNSDGYIITNHHVIEGARKITIVLSDKTELEAQLVGSDSLSDIAVIKVDTSDTDITLIPMEIGNSDELVVGEEVVAIGCPAGIEYMGTVTNGIVSAINRDIEITDSYGRVQKTMTLIQTNATINKGNSGGPLINSRGQVIGINTLKLTSQYEGIGFSIPMNGAMAIINQLIEHGEVIERTEEDFVSGSGSIGISGAAITEAEAKQFNIPRGVLVYQINKNSSAAKAGLRRGDIITKYNGEEVLSVDDINALKAKNRAGETVTVTVYRDAEDSQKDTDGETFDISFKLDPTGE